MAAAPVLPTPTPAPETAPLSEASRIINTFIAPSKTFTDLRRSAARDLRRAGVSEGEIMKLCGWKTRAMFDRYNIIDEADLAAAVAKRFNGKPAANTETPTEAQSPLSSSAA